MFIDVNDHIKVRVYYLKSGHTYESYTFSEFDKLKLRDSEKKKYKSLNLVMRQLTWGLQNDLQENALRDLPNGMSKFHYKTFKEGKLEKTIVSWSTQDEEGNDTPIKDKDGKEIKVSVDVIRGLAPEIAESIVRAYDNAVLLGDESEKK